MKTFILALAFLFMSCLTRAGTPAATAIDTISVMTINGNTILTAYSAIWVITATTTPDTVTLPAAAEVVDIIGQGAATDTAQISFAQASPVSGVLGITKYSEWLLGNAEVFRDFQRAEIKKLYWKAKSGTCKLWVRVYTWKP